MLYFNHQLDHKMKWLVVILLLFVVHVESIRPFSCGSFLNALAVTKTNNNKHDKTKATKNEKKNKKKISQRQVLEDDFEGKEPIVPGSSKFKLSLTQILSVAPIVAMLSSMLITMKVKVNDKSIQFKLRIIFGVYMAISQLLVFRLRSVINDADDDTLVTLPPAVNPLAMLTGQSPEAASSAPPVTKTAKEYDLDTLKSMSSGLLTEGAMALGMHFFVNKSGQSLVYSVCSGIANLINNQLVQIHILGLPATGLLARPFKSQSDRMMSDMKAKMLASQGVTDAAEADSNSSTSSTVEVTEVTDSDASAVKSSSVTSESVTAVVEEVEANEDDDEEDEEGELQDSKKESSTVSPSTSSRVSEVVVTEEKVEVEEEEVEEDGESSSEDDDSAISAAADELESALRDLALPPAAAGEGEGEGLESVPEEGGSKEDTDVEGDEEEEEEEEED